MIQQILHLLYIQKKKQSQTKKYTVINEIINSKDSTYKILFDTALKIVGIYKNGVFASSILTQYNIKKQTLQSLIDTLLKKELIDKEDDSYFTLDRTFELWVEGL